MVLRAKTRDALRAVRQAVVAVGPALDSALLLVLAVLSITGIAVGLGVLTTPYVLTRVRRHIDDGRRTPGRARTGPAGSGTGPAGQWQRTRRLLSDRTTWRDLRWLLLDSAGGLLLGGLVVGLIGKGLYGLVLAAGVWKPIHEADGGEWYVFLHVTSRTRAWGAAGLGLVLLALGLLYAPRIMAAHGRMTRRLRAPAPPAAAYGAELRRIERDLHDCAQAGLIAVEMCLRVVERLLDTEPAKARRLLAEARQSSADALSELRALVHGIHPPVLSERGLVGAVKALALRSPIRAEVTVELPGPFEPPVEAAAYFAVSELLANAAKHSGAGRIWLDLRYVDGTLRVTVGDDGRGGADPAAGSGLAGVERRLGAFDGVLAVSSPPGGPTTVTLELPCARR